MRTALLMLALAASASARVCAPVLCVAAHTGSMRPVIMGGEIVFVAAADFNRVAVGRVIVFERAGRYILHRVIARGVIDGETWLATKGDNNMDRDPWRVTAAEFVGVVALPKL